MWPRFLRIFFGFAFFLAFYTSVRNSSWFHFSWFRHDVDELYRRVSKIDTKISIATVYRTVKLFEESGILTKHEFKGGKARYEELNEGHHDHLIDVKTGEIIEFVDEDIEKLQKKVAEKYGYKLVDHKLELYGVKVNSKDE